MEGCLNGAGWKRKQFGAKEELTGEERGGKDREESGRTYGAATEDETGNVASGRCVR